MQFESRPRPSYQVRRMLLFGTERLTSQHTMPTTLSAKCQIVIPAEIRARYDLTPGTQVEFVDDGGQIRLVVLRRIAPSDPAAGFGLIKIPPRAPGQPARKLSQFDPASLVKKNSP
jgi:AbrB family looped-hinge helix DNA binding protein